MNKHIAALYIISFVALSVAMGAAVGQRSVIQGSTLRLIS
jgi:hypothetical protein